MLSTISSYLKRIADLSRAFVKGADEFKTEWYKERYGYRYVSFPYAELLYIFVWANDANEAAVLAKEEFDAQSFYHLGDRTRLLSC